MTFPVHFEGRSMTYPALYRNIAETILRTEPVNTGTWQTLDISASPAHATHEIVNASIHLDIPTTRDSAIDRLDPDLPWAEDHFLERVGGAPVNPGNTHMYWPYHGASAALHLKGKIYDHNYMERFWPKEAGWDNDKSVIPHRGIRFEYGDLNDVVALLNRHPGTRQAFLPVWFPEDTGGIHQQRVPCTLGYQFLIRNGELQVMYFMRSCEVYRHMTNDIYLACRLAQWVAERVDAVDRVGNLNMTIGSLHAFFGDTAKIKERAGL